MKRTEIVRLVLRGLEKIVERAIEEGMGVTDRNSDTGVDEEEEEE